MFAGSVVFFALGWAAVSSGAEKRLLKPEDFAAIRDVDEPQLSPDGQSVVYVVGTVDLAKDKEPKNLWIAKWDGSENRALTFGENEQTHPRWSPDGKWIAFLTGRGDERDNDQLWVLPSAGGEAEQLTREKGSVEGFDWSPDSKRLVLVVHDPDPREPEEKEKAKKTVPPIVIDRFQFKKDVEGYLTNRWSHLKLLDRASHQVDPLTSGQHDDLLPPGRRMENRSHLSPSAARIPIERRTGMSIWSSQSPARRSGSLRLRRKPILIPTGKVRRPGVRTAKPSPTFTAPIRRRSNMRRMRSRSFRRPAAKRKS
jgi:hypothetical protein